MKQLNTNAEVRVIKHFNSLQGEADILSKDILKKGSIKRKYPVEIPQMRCTFYTKKKLKGKALQQYIDEKLRHYSANFGNLKVYQSKNRPNRKNKKKEIPGFDEVRPEKKNKK